MGNDSAPLFVKRRVVVVDDTADIREALSMLLEELGHAVEVAAAGAAGVEAIVANRPDLSLIDLGLPGIDGFEVARRVRAAPGGQKLFLVALTGHSGSSVEGEAKKAGFDQLVVKPIGIKLLVELLAKLGR